VGGVLSVTYVADGQKTNPKFAAPKQYSATYTPAAAAELNQPDPVQAQAAAAGFAGGQALAQGMASPVSGLTAAQLAEAQANPATAALLAQLMPQNGAPAPAPVPAGDAPPF
jgi:hypothetical protein